VPIDGFQVTRPIAARLPNAARLRGDLTVRGALPPPGRFATFRNQVAVVLDGLGPSDERVFAEFRTLVAGVLDAPPEPVGTLTRLRQRIVETLMIDADWEVHPLPVDSVTPPCFMLEWADPWHNPATHCFTDAHLDVICIAPRLEPDPGIETLELMVESALGALHRAGIPCGEGSAPRPFEIGGITYLACRIPVHNTVNVGV
jgi:hypothetical protein